MSALRKALAGARLLGARLSIAFWSLVARARLRAHGAQVGRGLRVRGPIRLHCHRTGRIRIGDHCRIQSGFAGNAVGGGERFALWVGPDAQLQIGDRVGLSNATVVCMDTVVIADEVLIGGGTRIYDTDFHSLDPIERARPGNPGARTGPVRIGPRAFVGGHAILLKGTRIGEGAVIGAGAVVRGRVPSAEVWTGNPARFARRLAHSAARPDETPTPAQALRAWR
jgi:acetyltransferase-like isoleucine patch superfamily enzyme